MDLIFNLASGVSTANPALYVLWKKGYTLEVKVTKDERIFYIAEKEGRRFVGDTGPELLGLVGIWEDLGDNWREKFAEIPNILAEVIMEEDKP